MQHISINNMPNEVLVRILHSCDYITIIRNAHKTVSSSISLQLHIELEINGLEIADGSSRGTPNYSLSLKELRDYQDAWFNMKFGPMVQQPIGNPDIDVPNWGLRNNIYYGDSRISTPDLEDEDDYFVDRTQVVALGSSDIPPPTNFQKKFAFCEPDPQQDLAVLVEDEQQSSQVVRFHLHSLTSGQPHPLAEHPIITVSFDIEFLRANALMGEAVSADPEIMGNYFLVTLEWREASCDISETLLWDWKTGMLLARIQENNAIDCAFLDKEHFLAYSALPGDDNKPSHTALLVYRIPTVSLDLKEVPPNADFRPTSYSNSSPVLILEFPKLKASWRLTGQHLASRLEPLPGDVVYTKSATFLCSRVNTLFLHFRIRNALTWDSYASRSREGASASYRICVSTHHLFRHLKEYGLEDIPTRSIPWSQWGTKSTRWFMDDDSVEHMAPNLYGSQYVRATTIKSGTSQLLSIVNFNTPTIMRQAYISASSSRAKRTSADKAEKTAVLEGKGLTAGRLFQTRISSAKIPMPDFGMPLNHEIFTETIGRDMKTVLHKGLKESVESNLPYRVVTKAQRMPLHGHWRVIGEYLVGIMSRFTDILDMSMTAGRVQMLTNFPAEVIISILHHCHYRTILRFSMTSRKAYKVVRESISLQLHIELEVNGLEIASIDRSANANVDYRLILQELKDYQDAWLNLRLGPESVKSLPALDDSPVHHLRDGKYVGIFHEQTPGDGQVGVYRPFDHIQVADLNTLALPPPLKLRKFHAFTADPKQNLTVLIEYDGQWFMFQRIYIHFYDITTGQPHPLAHFPILTVQLTEFSESTVPAYGGSRAIVMGDLLIVSLLGHGSANILIWNWQRGTLLGQIQHMTRCERPIFLDRNHLVLCSFIPPSNSQLDSAREDQIGLLVYRIPSLATGKPQYPPTNPVKIYTANHIRINPMLVAEFPKVQPMYKITMYETEEPLALPGDLVFNKSAEVVRSHITTLSLCLFLQGPDRDRTNPIIILPYYSIFVNTNFIINYLSDNSSEGCVRIPWAHWGPTSTRWFSNGELSSAVTRGGFDVPYPHGSLHLGYAKENTGFTPTLTTHEFNPQIVRRHMPSSNNKERFDENNYGSGCTVDDHPKNSSSSNAGTNIYREPPKVVAESTVMHIGFEHPIESNLPYLIGPGVELENPYRCVVWRIHNDYLVGTVSGTTPMLPKLTTLVSKGTANLAL
ncbi:A Receptor for Ubiquitination Targets, partial [Rhizoctonia solani]